MMRIGRGKVGGGTKVVGVIMGTRGSLGDAGTMLRPRAPPPPPNPPTGPLQTPPPPILTQVREAEAAAAPRVFNFDELGAADAAALRASIDELEKAQATHARTNPPTHPSTHTFPPAPPLFATQPQPPDSSPKGTRSPRHGPTNLLAHLLLLAFPVPDSPPERLQQKARGWQAESPSATEPDELRAQLQGFWRLLITSSAARARDGVTGYGALHSAFTSWLARVHYTATSGLAPNPEPEPALCPTIPGEESSSRSLLAQFQRYTEPVEGGEPITLQTVEVVGDAREGRALVAVGKGDFRVSKTPSTAELGVLEVRASPAPPLHPHLCAPPLSAARSAPPLLLLLRTFA